MCKKHVLEKDFNILYNAFLKPKVEYCDTIHVRHCERCGCEMWSGYYMGDINGLYYCSEECYKADGITEKMFNDAYDDGDGDSYYTEWYDELETLQKWGIYAGTDGWEDDTDKTTVWRGTTCTCLHCGKDSYTNGQTLFVEVEKGKIISFCDLECFNRWRENKSLIVDMLPPALLENQKVIRFLYFIDSTMITKYLGYSYCINSPSPEYSFKFEVLHMGEGLQTKFYDIVGLDGKHLELLQIAIAYIFKKGELEK